MLSKLQWLFSLPEFRARPCSTLSRVLRWEVIRATRSSINIRLPNNVILAMNTRDGFARVAYYRGYNEPAIIALLEKFLRPGMCFVDVGAHVGTLALTAAQLVGPSGQVFAFEPSGSNFKLLLQNCDLNAARNVVAVNAAVGDSNQIGYMCPGHDSSDGHVAVADAVNAGERVSIVTLDSHFLPSLRHNLNYLKIDVEGFELKVLLGAQKTLEEKRPEIIQVEVIEPLLLRAQTTRSELFTFLQSAGYEPRSLDFDRCMLTAQPPRDWDAYRDRVGANIFFVAKERSGSLGHVVAN